MSLVDQMNAATKSLDQILKKLEKANPIDKPRLESAARAAQAKLQSIIFAIQNLHS